MRKSDLMELVDKKFPELIQTASELVKIPSRNPPGEEKNCAEYIYSRLKEFGLETYFVREPFEDRPQVVALARGKSKDTIILNGHMDTVPEGDPEDWSIDPFSGLVKDGLLYGRGSVDMKSALAIMMYATKFADENASILLTFAVGEERAEPGTSALLSYVKKFDLNVRYGLVMEPTAMDVASCQKGAAWFRLRIRGKAVHASTPNKGVNAVENALDVMKAINNYRNEISKTKHRLGDPPTSTITMINGGFKENVIPDKCELVIDRRLVPGESSIVAENELRSVVNKLHISCELEKIASREPVEMADDSAIAKAMIDSANETTGRNTKIICFAGATDNEHLVTSGIQSVVWGPGNFDKAHAIDECISTEEIRQATITIGLMFGKLSV